MDITIVFFFASELFNIGLVVIKEDSSLNVNNVRKSHQVRYQDDIRLYIETMPLHGLRQLVDDRISSLYSVLDGRVTNAAKFDT